MVRRYDTSSAMNSTHCDTKSNKYVDVTGAKFNMISLKARGAAILVRWTTATHYLATKIL